MIFLICLIGFIVSGIVYLGIAIAKAPLIEEPYDEPLINQKFQNNVHRNNKQPQGEAGKLQHNVPAERRSRAHTHSAGNAERHYNAARKRRLKYHRNKATD